LLLAYGHHDARAYPIGLIFDEAEIVVDRLNRDMASEAMLTMMAISANFSKPASREFYKTIAGLKEDDG
jgi:hypothetical protein